MSDAPIPLRGSAGSVRVRLLGPAAAGALHTGYDIWSPVDFYLSPFRERYLAGEVKGVIASVPAKLGRAFESFNVVPVPAVARAEVARRHRDRLETELRAQYKNAVVRACTGSPAASKRLRSRTNQRLANSAPPIAEVDQLFADRPEALAAAAEIKAIWRAITEQESN